MAYQAISFTFGEQPSAAKWNILGTNDASFNDGTGVGDDAIKSRAIDWAATGGGDTGGIWWEELGRTTLGSAGDVITVDSLPARKYLQVRIHLIASGTCNLLLRYNNDSGNNYSRRVSANGAADSTATSTTSHISVGFSGQAFAVGDIINVATQEKLLLAQVNYYNTAGAGAANNRIEATGKWANTSVQITRIDVVQTDTGDYAAGSECVVLGHN